MRRGLWSAALYRHDGQLWVRRRWRRFALEPGMTAELTRAGCRRRLTIWSGNEAVWSCTYRPSFWNSLVKGVFDVTVADPEDFDFGVLVSNVLGEPGRFERYRAGGG